MKFQELYEMAMGGLSEGMSLEDIAKKHKVDIEDLEKELEIQEKKVEQQRHWLDNAHQVFGKMLNSSSANWNNVREKIILASADKQELELQLVADNRERAAIAKEIAVLKSSLDKLIAKEGEIPNSVSCETVESFF